MPTMFILPWRWTGATRPERAVVFAGRFDAKGLRARWVLFRAGIRLRRAVLTCPGALGVSLRAHPFAGRYFTLSMWKDEASLLAFARGDDHRRELSRINELGPVNGILISREADCARPGWPATLQWVAHAEPGPYRHRAEAGPQVAAP